MSFRCLARRRGTRSLFYAVETCEPRRLFANITVTTVVDAMNYPSTVTAAQLGATVSLRDALTAAGNTAASNTINFSATAFPTATTTTINLNGTQFSVNNAQPLTINGGNAVTLRGNGSRILQVGGAGGVTINNVAFTNGSSDAGGAIYNGGSNLTVSGSSFTGNTATAFGGALASPNGGTVNIIGSTFSGNTAGNEASAIEQQGIAGSAASMTIVNSTFTGNIANGSGFGTISNVASGGNATLVIQDSTLANNTGTNGGGVLNAINSGNATITYVGTIFANIGANIVNFSGSVTSLGHNLSSDATGNLSGVGDKPSTNPRLGSLLANGNAPSTLPLLPGSPAINAGVAVAGVTADQRGIARTQGSTPDIGAFESRGFNMTVNAGNNQTAAVNLPGGSTAAFPTQLRVNVTSSFSEPVNGGIVNLAVVPAGNGASASLSASPVTIASNLASFNATPNAIAGSYTVNVTAAGAPNVAFALTNVQPVKFTNLRMVNANDVATPNPVIGEMLFVEASWNTQALVTGASYAIRFVVDGVALQTDTLTLGAGAGGAGSWFWYRGGWYATAGTHHVEISVVSPTLSDSTMSLDFTTHSATDLPAKFVYPIGGQAFKSWGVVNYVDIDPTSGIKDYNGGTYTYDGHYGHDITLSNFSTMDDGVPDYAAAAGTVTAVGDGFYDRNSTMPSNDANYVVINHGNGWETIYYHLRTNSIIVRVGDPVVAGQIIGLAGSSGFSSAAHLHFEVHHNGSVVEPQLDPNTFWLSPPPYMDTIASGMESGLTTNFTIATGDLNAEERPVTVDVFRQVDGQQLVFWLNPNTPANTPVEFVFYRPDGTISTGLSLSFTASQQRGGYRYRTILLASNVQLGTWIVISKMNGVEVARNTFQVTANGASAARVSQDTTYVANNRSTPIDFGSVAPAAAAPQLPFTITNLGTAALALSNLVLPTGYSLVGSLPASIAVGATATLALQLNTAVSGLYTGVVSMMTNDPHASTYRFKVKGRVTGGNTGGVHGMVYRDAAQNGYADGIDAGMEGWTVSLLNPTTSAVVAATTTSFNGLYSFNNLANATYRVRVTPKAGWSQTSANPADVVVAASADVLAQPVGVFGAITVSTLVDEDNGTADPFVGNGLSLREAINFANKAGTPQTVTFAPSLTSGGAATITLTLGELEITRGLTLTGPGANLLTISGNNASRVIYAFATAPVAISGLTLANGASPNAGGGLLNIQGTVNLNAVHVTGNNAAAYGGGLASPQGGVVNVTNSTFSNNIAGQEAGGLESQGTATLAASVSIINSTFFGNVANTFGLGGAISNVATGGAATLTIQNSTIANNSGSYSGGILNAVNSGTAIATYINSVFANNTNGNIRNEGGTVTSLGHNLSTDNTGNLTAAGDLRNTDAALGALGFNGGPTPTMLPQPNSPLINAGVTIAAITTDQRGILRPQGIAPDIGAVERIATPSNAISSSFEYDTRLAVIFQMDADASVSISRSSIQLVDTATNQPVNVGTLAISNDGGIVTLVLTNLLPDGNYKATLGSITQTFFVLRADFDRDHTVGFSDLVTLSQNYNLTGRTLSTGDTNYDGIVDFADLVALSQTYGRTLAIADLRAPTVKTVRAKSVSGDVLA